MRDRAFLDLCVGSGPSSLDLLPTLRWTELYMETLIAIPTPGYLWLYM